MASITWFLMPLDPAAQLALHVGADIGAEALDVAVGDAIGTRQLGVDLRQDRGLHRGDRDLEGHRLTGQRGHLVNRGEAQIQGA
jgi:hypothetical protein